jgi:hypothetical protein
MIQPTIYTLDNGQTYHMSFDKSAYEIKSQTNQNVQFIRYDDLLKLRHNIEKIVVKFK